jgi:hypothetical protein
MLFISDESARWSSPSCWVIGDDSTELSATEATRKTGKSSKSTEWLLEMAGSGEGGVREARAKNAEVHDAGILNQGSISLSAIAVSEANVSSVEWSRRVMRRTAGPSSIVHDDKTAGGWVDRI